MRNEKELNRQEILEKALDKELKYLKKMIYYRQRRTLLFDDVKIEEVDFNNNTAGLYEYDEKNFTHVIKISSEELDREIARGRKRVDAYTRILGLTLRDIIRHELVHAFVNEKYQHITPQIGHMNADASPIFLSVLTFVKGETNHDCKWAYKETDLYKEIRVIDNYSDLHAKLIKLLMEYKKIADYFSQDETRVELLSVVNFNFGSRSPGLEKFTQFKTDYKLRAGGKIVLQEAKACRFNIGCNIKPEQIIELVKRKLKNNEGFKYAEEQVVYATVKNKEVHILKESKEVYNNL